MFGILGIKTKRHWKQRGKGFQIGLLASGTAPILGEVAKPLLKKFFGGQRRRRRIWEKK